LSEISGDLAEALRLIRDLFERRQISFALIGAVVPAIYFSPVPGKLQIGDRETRDVDHVIHVSSWEEWDAIGKELVERGFKRAEGLGEHRFSYQTAEVDFLPYGTVISPDDVLVWRKSGKTMNMLGFSDAFRFAVPVSVGAGIILPVIPLWLFAALKIITYLDRKAARDLSDLVYVLDQYEPLGTDSRRFDVLSESQGITYEASGAFLLGKDILSNASPLVIDSVKKFLLTIEDEFSPVIIAILTEEQRVFSDERRLEIFGLFAATRLGLGI
jgi:predicted nucleotidyltransferase